MVLFLVNRSSNLEFENVYLVSDTIWVKVTAAEGEVLVGTWFVEVDTCKILV
jgi:hypothetical protein